MGMYKENWAKYRILNRLTMLNLIFGLPLIVLICLNMRWYFKIDSSLVFPLMAILWAVSWGLMAFKLIRFPCPRCNAPFLANQTAKLKKDRSCVNCGLKLYGDTDSAEADSTAKQRIF